MSALDQIRKRHKERRDVLAESANLKFTPVMLTDKKARKTFDSQVREASDKFLDACFLVGEDVQVLISSLIEVCERAGAVADEIVAKNWSKIRLDESTKSVLFARQMAEAAEREEEARKRGESPGQKKMIKDDGSVAEEASPVKKAKLTPANDPSSPISPKELASGKKQHVPAGAKESTARNGARSSTAADKTAVAAAFINQSGHNF